MKKLLPLILLLIGIGVVVGVVIFVSGQGGEEEVVEEYAPDLAFDQRPFTSLTPDENGNYLKLEVLGIDVEGAASMDYELLYKVADGRTQGVPGSVKLDGKDSIERDLLLGSESSGVFRYDEGVESGTLTIKFRNDDGKLIGRVSTDFSLVVNKTKLASADGKFTYALDETADDVYFIVMETFGLPGRPADGEPTAYGVFSSSSGYPGTVTGASNYWDGTEWTSISGASGDIGVFY